MEGGGDRMTGVSIIKLEDSLEQTEADVRE